LIRRKTTFVVGAGSSFELGLPLGDKLRDEIAKLIDIRFKGYNDFVSGDHSIYLALKKHCESFEGLGINDLLHKCWLLRDGLPAAISIDNLLDAHRHDEHIAFIGKVAIAKSILAAERASTLYWDRNNQKQFQLQQAVGSWLIPLFQKLTENVAKEDADEIFKNVCFVVFNYDRCLEYFLPRALSAYYGLSDEEAKQIAGSAIIYHPYGQVGALTQGASEGVAEFGESDRNLDAVVTRIRTFTEGLRYESHSEAIKESLRTTENLVFLGFAFHPINMEILRLTGESNLKKVFGTTVGLADAAVRRVKEDIFLTLNKRVNDGKHASAKFLDEINLEARGASDFLYAHFRSLE